jgi:hypothetical protein
LEKRLKKGEEATLAAKARKFAVEFNCCCVVLEIEV